MSFRKADKAFDLLKDYNGTNPYMLILQREIFAWRRTDSLDDFKVEFILRNYSKEPVTINKVVRIADWYGEKKQIDWQTEFVSEKIKIVSYLGDTESHYCCYVKYRQSVDPVLTFLPKKAVLTNFFAKDHTKLFVDFDRYDRLSMNIDPNRRLREHQKTGVRFLLSRQKCILADDMGLGKLQPISSIIPTPNGFKKMGDIKVGDQVFGSDGKPCNVLKVFPHKNKEIYEITFSDGTKCECGLEHLWKVRDSNMRLRKQGWKTISLEKMLEIGLVYNSSARTNPIPKFEIPVCEPVLYPQKEHLIHPYLLGIAIGDGHITNGIIISIPDKEIETVDRLSKLIREDYKLHPNRSGVCPNYRIGKKTNNNSPNIYTREIKRLNLNVIGKNKFIPEEYKYDSVENRIELLRGLMDSDGTITTKGNKISFSTTSNKLAEDVVELVYSLGGIAKKHTYDRRKEGKNVEYMVSMQIKINPFKIERKSERYKPTFKKYCTKHIVSAKYIRNEDAQCILVDSYDNTYLTDKNYIVTHNTTTLSVAAIEGNFDSVLIICPASLKTNWKKELMWYVPERDITIVDGFNDKKKSELEEFLGYAIGKSGKKKEELLSEAKDKGKWVDNRFVIVNYDILEEFYEISRVRSEAQVAKLVENNPMLKYLYNRKSLIIIDEAHKLSNNTSSRYKIINDLIKRADPHSIYLSTGTPVTNAPQNLYCLLKLLNDPIANDWEFFMERYCGAEKIFAPGEWVRLSTVFFKKVGKSSFGELTSEEKDRCREYVNKYAKKITVAKEATHIDDLKEAISHIYLRREKSDVTDLPVKTVHEVRYDLTETQRNKYERLWDEYEQATLAENPDKNLNKDLMEGSIYRIYLAEQMVKHTIELANKFIENGDKVVIACCYDNELYALKDYYGDRCVIYNGKCSLKQKDAAIEKFKNDDNVKVFIGNIISAGVGITLINSHRLIFCSYDYVYANNSQMEDRIHRIGQTEKCDVYYQMFNDTHCEHMWDIVLKKQYLSDTLITSDGK